MSAAWKDAWMRAECYDYGMKWAWLGGATKRLKIEKGRLVRAWRAVATRPAEVAKRARAAMAARGVK